MSTYRKQLDEMVKQAEEQGWTIERSKDGVTFFPPDKSFSPRFAHFTPSDHRAWKNFRSKMRQAGFQDPDRQQKKKGKGK